MKTKYLISFIIISFVIIGSVILVDKAGKISAQETTGAVNIQYPVKELGNCKDETACRTYCDKPQNMKACIDFAEKSNLMSKEEIEMAKKFIAVGGKGPGGCQGRNECDTYCNDIDHIDECISFAEKNNLIPPEELGEAKKVQAAIRRGVKPPACPNKKQCDIYCEDPAHMEECITFGIEAGFIQGQELEDVQKMLAAVKRGVKPPPCRGKEACDEYCGDPNNMEVCMTFAIEAGFMSETEKADSQKMLEALKKGVKPPNCRGKEECDIYCSQEEHFEECTNFAEAAGFISPEDAVMVRKTKGKSPGNCRGKEECEAFCNNPDNQEICFNFAKEHGLMPEEDLKRMEEGKQKFRESLEQAPPQVIECLNSLVGSEQIEKFKSGAVMPPREIGDKMRECFEKTMGPSMGSESPTGPGMMPEGQTGPGGCESPDECKVYCEANPEECKNFQLAPPTSPVMPEEPVGPGGMVPSEGQAGPGGCKTPEECQAYCISHPEECQTFQQPSMPGEQPPEGNFPPPSEGQQPPTENIVPPPTETPPPSPPSGFLNPQSLLGLIFYIFTQAFHP